MKAMLFRCKHCGGATAPGAEVCRGKKCQDKEVVIQTWDKCRELGMAFPSRYYARAP